MAYYLERSEKETKELSSRWIIIQPRRSVGRGDLIKNSAKSNRSTNTLRYAEELNSVAYSTKDTAAAHWWQRVNYLLNQLGRVFHWEIFVYIYPIVATCYR